MRLYIDGCVVDSGTGLMGPCTTIIRYPAAQVDEEDGGDSTGEIPDNNDNDDDDDDVDEDIQQTATEIGTK